MDTHRELYKSGAKNLLDLQEKRRQEALEKQKSRRAIQQTAARNIQQLPEEIKPDLNAESTSSNHVPACYTSKRFFRLQLSEWLRGVPQDLDDWQLVPCPKGERCLVIAHKNCTKSYNKYGRPLQTFASELPGDASKPTATTVLDCIYDKTSQTFFVLDLLAYNDQNFLDCEAQCRFFILKARLEEMQLHQRTQSNGQAFVYLERYSFAHEACRISELLLQYPLWQDNKPELDGLLFYQQDASYTRGQTPLVGWLMVYMLPEVLGMAVNEQYEQQKPIDYSNALEYMEQFDAAKLEKQKQRKKQQKKRRQKHKKITCDEEEEHEEGESLQELEMQDIDNLVRVELELEQTND